MGSLQENQWHELGIMRLYCRYFYYGKEVFLESLSWKFRWFFWFYATQKILTITTTKITINPNYRNIEYPELEGTDKDHRVQLLALLSTTWNSNLESVLQTLLNSGSLGSPFHALPAFEWRTFSSHPVWPSADAAPCCSKKMTANGFSQSTKEIKFIKQD